MYICESGDSYRTFPCVCLLTRSVCSLAALTASAWRSVLHKALQASSSLLRLKMASVSHLRSQSWATDACSKTTTELEHGSRFACLQTCLQSSELKTVRYDLIPERCSVCQLLQTLCILMAWTSPTESRPLIRLKGLSCGVKRLAVTPSLSVYEFSASIDCLLCFCLLRVLCLIPIAIFLVIIAFGLCFGEGKPQKNRKECQLTSLQGHANVTLMQEKF